MILLGLTGSIGMGKSTVAAMFEGAGVPLFDADAEVHAMQGPGGVLLPAIEAAFPGSTSERGVDRAKLGAMVFGKPQEMARLEAIVHPAVEARRKAFLRRHRFHRLVMVDVPLLFETGGWRKVDAVAVVSAPPAIQRRRVLRRPGMTEEKFRAILKLQMPDREKRRRADFIIPTGCPRSRTAAAVRALTTCLRTRGVRYCRTCGKLFSIPRRPDSIRPRVTGSSKSAVLN